MAISVSVEPDGGNPREASAIWRLGDGHFRVRPFSEDGDDNYKFALNVRVTNTGAEAAPVTLDVDWADVRYMVSRQHAHVGSGDDWTFVPAQVAGTVATVTGVVPPRESWIGLSPPYGLARHQQFAGQLAGLGYEQQRIGETGQGRPVETYSIGNGPAVLLVIARVHPYETAASWCAEGLLEWLAADGSPQARLRQQYRIVTLPMPNPDGVILGMCKRTSEQGVDLSHEAMTGHDATTAVFVGLLDATRPAALLDIHGWMHADEDGLDQFDAALGERFTAAADSEPVFRDNRWKHNLERVRAGSPRQYCRERYGTVPLAVSYRWPGRDVAAMREIGAATLRCFVAAL